jgi:hypothetical protein
MTITSTEAARSLGAIRSEKKSASSRRNLAKARATTAAALAAYKAAQDGEAKSVALTALKTAMVHGEQFVPKPASVVPTLFVAAKGSK